MKVGTGIRTIRGRFVALISISAFVGFYLLVREVQ